MPRIILCEDFKFPAKQLNRLRRDLGLPKETKDPRDLVLTIARRTGTAQSNVREWLDDWQSSEWKILRLEPRRKGKARYTWYYPRRYRLRNTPDRQRRIRKRFYEGWEECMSEWYSNPTTSRMTQAGKSPNDRKADGVPAHDSSRHSAMHRRERLPGSLSPTW